MDNTDLWGKDIEVHKNVQGHMDCKELCEGETECSFWTYISGRCYLKNNDVYISEYIEDSNNLNLDFNNIINQSKELNN